MRSYPVTLGAFNPKYVGMFIKAQNVHVYNEHIQWIYNNIIQYNNLPEVNQVLYLK